MRCLHAILNFCGGYTGCVNSKILLKWVLRVICRSWLAGGICSLVAAIAFGIFTGVFVARSVPATGTIVDLIPNRDKQNKPIDYTPVFSFVAGDGNTYKIEWVVASNPPGFNVGQKVQVLYVPGRPAGARLASFGQLWFVSIVCAGLGAFFTAAGYMLLRFERWRDRLRIPAGS